MEEEENENPEPEFQKEEVLPLPFPIFTIKKIAKQALIVHKQDKPNYQRGISQKAAVVLSFATGIFLKHLSRDIVGNSPEKYFKRKVIASALLKNPIYRFTMDRMKTSELLDSFTNDNEISRRIISHHIEVNINFPIEFVAPHPPEKHVYNEERASKNQDENIEAVIKVCVMSKRAFTQAVPYYFLPSKFH